jgi:hypothetical protein
LEVPQRERAGEVRRQIQDWQRQGGPEAVKDGLLLLYDLCVLKELLFGRFIYISTAIDDWMHPTCLTRENLVCPIFFFVARDFEMAAALL